MQYRCKLEIFLDNCDDDGFLIEESGASIEPGEVFEKEETNLRVAGAPETIRLSNDRCWIEIMPETLKEHFELIEDGEK